MYNAMHPPEWSTILRFLQRLSLGNFPARAAGICYGNGKEASILAVNFAVSDRADRPSELNKSVRVCFLCLCGHSRWIDEQ